jgi:hypothetical protein
VAADPAMRADHLAQEAPDLTAQEVPDPTDPEARAREDQAALRQEPPTVPTHPACHQAWPEEPTPVDRDATARPTTSAPLDHPDQRVCQDVPVWREGPDWTVSPAKTPKMSAPKSKTSELASTAPLDLRDHPDQLAAPVHEDTPEPRDNPDFQDATETPELPESLAHLDHQDLSDRSAQPERRDAMRNTPLAVPDQRDNADLKDPRDHKEMLAKTQPQEPVAPPDHKEAQDPKDHPEMPEPQERKDQLADQAKMPNTAHAQPVAQMPELTVVPVEPEAEQAAATVTVSKKERRRGQRNEFVHNAFFHLDNQIQRFGAIFSVFYLFARKKSNRKSKRSLLKKKKKKKKFRVVPCCTLR